MLKQTIIFLCTLLTLVLGADDSLMLYSYTFKNGAEGWTPQGKARLSDLSRLEGGKSLRLTRESKEDDGVPTSWTSPVLSGGGKNVTVGFWVAENYKECRDYSYSASVQIEACEKNGNGIRDVSGLIYLDWDVTQRGSWAWGERMSDSLVWKYYSYDVPASVEHFRIIYKWPKPLVRGSCYLTDVSVRVNVSAAQKAAIVPEEKTVSASESPVRMWLSAPALDHVFYSGDALRFDVAVYGTGKKLELPSDSTLQYTVTDYNRETVVKGQASFQGARPIEDAAFYKTSIAATRKITPENFLVKRLVLPQEQAGDDGRLFFLTVSLTAPDGAVLAEDTIPYGVMKKMVHPYKTASDSRFYGWHWSEPYRDSGSAESALEQKLSVKHGMVRECQFNYDWKKDQPVYPGPIQAKNKYSGTRLVTYMPNIEQVNGETLIPDGAITKRTGVKTEWHGEMVDYNVEAYVAYMVEYIRENRKNIDWVVPSGLERRTTSRTVELQKKAYTAIKKEFPDIKIGYSCYGGIKEIESEGLHNYLDFITNHLYDASINWAYKKDLEAMYQRLGKPLPPLTNTEFAIVAGNDQLAQSISATHGIWEMIENDIVGINSFAVPGSGKNGGNDPILTEMVDSPYTIYQTVKRPLIAPEAVDKNGKRVYRESVNMPVLKTMTYYNFTRDFDWTKFRKKIPASENVAVSIFDRDDVNNSTRCGIRTKSGVPAEIIRVVCDQPYTYKDMFGKKTRIVPINGESFLTATQYPATLIFDQNVKNIDFKSIALADAVVKVGRGAEQALAVDLPFSVNNAKLTADFQVSGSNAMSFPGTIVTENGKTSVKAKLMVPADAEPGVFPLSVVLKNADDAVFAMLAEELAISESLDIELEPVGFFAKTGPGLKVILMNRDVKAQKGLITFKNSVLTAKLVPENESRGFKLEPGMTEEFFFPVPKELASMTFNETVGVEVVLDNGKIYTKEVTLFFRSCLYAEKELKIDGDLSDWPLEKLRPVRMERKNVQADGETANGEFYTMWRDDVLYFALKVKDATPVHRHNDVGLWVDDNIMLGIYPWRWKIGEPMKSSMYREHIGLNMNGTVGKYRVGTLNGGLDSMDTVDIAVRQTPDGYIYEMAYPKAAVFPLELKEGNGFRIALLLFDAFQNAKGQYTYTVSYFGGFTSSVDLQPNKWFEFIFVK